MGKKTEIVNVERLEMMEEKYGVSIEGVYAEYEIVGEDSFYINVRGEIQSINGTQLDESIDIIVTAYDTEGKVTATGGTTLDAEEFFGISPFDICTDIIDKPTKIRIYPKSS